MSALIAWLGTQTGFINEPQSHLTCYHNPRINPREHGLNFNGEAYLCIPVDGDGGAWELLTKIIEAECADSFEDAVEILQEVSERARELQALLPGKSEVKE